MTGINHSVIRQSVEFNSYAVVKLRRIASGQVGTSYGSGKQHVAGYYIAPLRVIQGNAPLRMSRNMQHFEHSVAYMDLVTVIKVGGQRNGI